MFISIAAFWDHKVITKVKTQPDTNISQTNKNKDGKTKIKQNKRQKLINLKLFEIKTWFLKQSTESICRTDKMRSLKTSSGLKDNVCSGLTASFYRFGTDFGLTALGTRQRSRGLKGHQCTWEFVHATLWNQEYNFKINFKFNWRGATT